MSTGNVNSVKRGRGRPRKVVATQEEPAARNSTLTTPSNVRSSRSQHQRRTSNSTPEANIGETEVDSSVTERLDYVETDFGARGDQIMRGEPSGDYVEVDVEARGVQIMRGEPFGDYVEADFGARGDQVRRGQHSGDVGGEIDGADNVSTVSCNYSSVSRKREALMKAAERRAKIRKLTIEEYAKVELQRVEEELAAEIEYARELETADCSSIRARSHPPTMFHEVDSQYRARDNSEERAEGVRNGSIYLNEVRGNQGQFVRRVRDPELLNNRDDVNDGLIKKLADTIDVVKQIASNSQGSQSLVTRLTTTKALPSFSGDALEWLHFKQAYQVSTELGKYTERENLSRLYEALKGPAKEAVDSLMITATSADTIISSLELRFGNPNRITERIVDDIKKLPALRLGRIDLVSFATKVRNSVAAMETLQHVGYLHSPELLREILEKLPFTLLHGYNRYVKENPCGVPKLKALSEYLYSEAEMSCKAGTDSIYRTKTDSRSCASKNTKGIQRRVGMLHSISSVDDEDSFNVDKRGRKKNCLFCHKLGHEINICWAFERRSVPERWKWIKEKKLCFKCLSTNHRSDKCRVKGCSADGCEGKHHSLLHKFSNNNNRVTENQSRSIQDRLQRKWEENPQAITPARVTTYALLDEGSTITVISSKTAKSVGSRGTREVFRLEGPWAFGKIDVQSEKISLKIKGQYEEFALENVHTVGDLRLPEQSVTSDLIDSFSYPCASVLPIYVNARPTILLGQDNCRLIVSRETYVSNQSSLAASRTSLGWTVHGPAGKANSLNCELVNCVINDTSTLGDNQKAESLINDNLYELVKSHFQLESIRISGPTKVSKGEQRARNILETTRKISSKWETGLLWKEKSIDVSSSRVTALKRLCSLENRFRREPQLGSLYQQEIERLLKMGYAEKLDDRMKNKKGWYIPHFAVHNPNKPNKIRLVFDAAARTEGKSLNDQLLAGPMLLNSLPGVLMRFRERPVGIKGDIKDMFLRVNVRKEDQSYQRFLWRESNRHGHPEEYVMKTLIFGSKCSPCSAIYVRNRNAEECETSMPLAASAIIRNSYVDNYLDSCETEESAIQRIEEVSQINALGNFQMHSWVTNSKEVSSALDNVTVNQKNVNLNITTCANALERTLGLIWDTDTDTFKFEVNRNKTSSQLLDGNQKPTKRQFLSVIMSVFDPLGFLTPLTIQSRINMQNVWSSGITWDSELRDEELKLWKEWLEKLKKIVLVTIPRCYLITDRGVKGIELHVFTDASLKAYATVAYWRIELNDNSILTSFITAKGRVAPLKPLSVPRLELQAALMGSRLANFIATESNFQVNRRVFWTDSRTVILWINSDPRSYQAFVGQRLGEIIDLTDPVEWKWVPSTLNPADDATKQPGKDMHENSRWFNGPSFLRCTESDWPNQDFMKMKDKEKYVLERKKGFVGTLRNNIETPVPDPGRFSSWIKFLNCLAWVLVAKEKWKRENKDGMTVEHRESAERLIILTMQKESFADELSDIDHKRSLSKRSQLQQLMPFKDDDGILRVKSPVKLICSEPFNNQPAIIDGKHPITRLIIKHYHEKSGHENNNRVMNEIRQRYWVLKLRNALKSVVTVCQLCKLRRSKPQTQVMGMLPDARLAYHERPFTHCGVDYFGPMEVTIGRRRERDGVFCLRA